MVGTMVSAASSIRWLLISIAVMIVRAEDPYLFFTWDVTYGTLSPLGVPEQVILINGKFPGPDINSTSNNNLMINVFNKLDEPLLFHWSGIQLRKNSWQDGTPGTMCPILPGTNYTYHIQVKDQIGTFMYYPSLGFQKASGGFGGLRVHSRDLIPVPFDNPEDEFTIFIGDWYSQGQVALRKILDDGKSLGKPDGVLINGKKGNVGDESEEPLCTMKPGKTYRYRVCNAGMRNSLNFRIQNHKMKLVELEGSHVMQNEYDTIDVHLGQCFSVLVTADQSPTDYYMVASSRFTKYDLQATAKIRYEGGTGAASTELPKPPTNWAWSLNQFRSFRWNLTASAARPNPQGSYRYGSVNITRTIKLANTMNDVDGKLRYAINGHSHKYDGDTPFKLAEYFGVADKVFKYDTIGDTPPPDVDNDKNIEVGPIVMNATFRTFVEIIFENHETGIQYWHFDGYSFFAVGIEVGEWTPESRKNYNLLDAVSRYSIPVFPKSWAAILLDIDNAGMWNIRSECLEKSYLGQQMYLSVVSPARSLRDEYSLPESTLLCGIVKDLPKPPPYT